MLLQLTARILLTLALIMTTVPLKSQAEFKGWSFDTKAGLCIGTNFQGFGAGLDFSLITNQSEWSFDFYYGAEFTLFGSDPARLGHLGILYGKYTGPIHFRIQYLGGLAPTWGILGDHYTDTGDYIEDESFMTIGLVGKLGLKIVPSHNFSFGADLQGNLNLKNPMLMISFSIEFGKLRTIDDAPGTMVK